MKSANGFPRSGCPSGDSLRSRPHHAAILARTTGRRPFQLRFRGIHAMKLGNAGSLLFFFSSVAGGGPGGWVANSGLSKACRPVGGYEFSDELGGLFFSGSVPPSLSRSNAGAASSGVGVSLMIGAAANPTCRSRLSERRLASPLMTIEGGCRGLVSLRDRVCTSSSSSVSSARLNRGLLDLSAESIDDGEVACMAQRRARA